MNKNTKKIISRVYVIALLIALLASSVTFVCAGENAGPFSTNFIAPENGEEITVPGGVFTENPDGSITVSPGENPWFEYRLYKKPVEAKGSSYTVEVTFNGELPTWGSVGMALGLEGLTPVGFGAGPDNPRSSKGLYIRFINADANYIIAPDGKDKEGNWIYVNYPAVMAVADYSTATKYTIKAIVKDTEDPEVKQADIFVDSTLVCENIAFKPSGKYMGILSQQTRGTVIHNIKINGEVIAGVDYVAVKPGQETEEIQTKDNEAAKTDTSVVVESPKTGETTSVWLLAVVMFTSVACMCALLVFKRGLC